MAQFIYVFLTLTPMQRHDVTFPAFHCVKKSEKYRWTYESFSWIYVQISAVHKPSTNAFTKEFIDTTTTPNDNQVPDWLSSSLWNIKSSVMSDTGINVAISSSSVNGRRFSVENMSALTWKSTDLIYVITWRAANCKMQYVGQTNRLLKTRFNEHYRRMSKPKKLTPSCTVTLNGQDIQ